MNKERGAILAFSLLLLIGLTIIIVVSLNTVIMDQKINSNLSNYQYNEEANEAAFTEAKAWLDTQLLNPPQCTNLSASCSTVWGQNILDPNDNLKPWGTGGRSIPGTYLANITSQPQFMIEQYSCNAGAKNRIFKVTTRSVDPRGTAVLYKQNYVTSLLGPPPIPHTYYSSNYNINTCSNPFPNFMYTSFVADQKGQLNSIIAFNADWNPGCPITFYILTASSLKQYTINGNILNFTTPISVNPGDYFELYFFTNCGMMFPPFIIPIFNICIPFFLPVFIQVNGLVPDPNFCQ